MQIELKEEKKKLLNLIPKSNSQLFSFPGYLAIAWIRNLTLAENISKRQKREVEKRIASTRRHEN